MESDWSTNHELADQLTRIYFVVGLVVRFTKLGLGLGGLEVVLKKDAQSVIRCRRLPNKSDR
jgi:hypothetical protein